MRHLVLQELHDIVKQCLQKDPALRPTTSQLLKHKFFKVPLLTLTYDLHSLAHTAPVGCHTWLCIRHDADSPLPPAALFILLPVWLCGVPEPLSQNLGLACRTLRIQLTL